MSRIAEVMKVAVYYSNRDVRLEERPVPTIGPGELLVKKGGEEFYLAVSGGFIEVRPDHIIILADADERVEEIDVKRAEKAKQRAQERLAKHTPDVDVAKAEAALRRSLTRLEVVQRRKRRPGSKPA